MWRKFKKIIHNSFKLSNWKRIFIIIFTLIASICVITFTSIFYLSKNVNKSIEYNKGIQVLVQIDNNASKISQNDTNDIIRNINNRLTGGVSFNGTKIEAKSLNQIEITKTGDFNDKEKEIFIKSIIDKSNLIFTDTNMIPLFVNGKFNSNKENIDYDNLQKYIVPSKINSAKTEFAQTANNYAIRIELQDSSAQIAWTDATDYISKNENKTLLMWLNLDKLINLAKSEFPQQWLNAKENPYNFVFVDEKPFIETDNQVQNNILKLKQFNAKEFLINQETISQALSGSSFLINGNFNSLEAEKIAANINYGTSTYELNFLTSNYIDNTNTFGSFENILIAGIVILSLIIIFMLINYGLLGVLNTISLSLFIFLTLLMFTILRGEYSPITITSLIIVISIAFNTNITIFEKLKQEIYNGEKLKKAIKKTYRYYTNSILDTNILILLVAFIMFYIGINDVKAFSLILVFSAILNIIIILFLTKLLTHFLIFTGYFDKKLWLLGINYKKINNINSNTFYNKYDYEKNSKWYFLSSILIICIALIIYASISGYNNNIWDGFNRSFSLKTNTNIIIQGDLINPITNLEAQNIKSFLLNNQESLKINNLDNYLHILPANYNVSLFKISINIPEDLTNNLDNIKSIINNQFPLLNITSFITTPIEIKRLIINASTAIGICSIIIIIYALIKFKWTYSLTIMLILIHNILLTLSIIVITRMIISPIIISAFLAIIILSINHSFMIFNHLKNKIDQLYYQDFLNKEQLKQLINETIKENIKKISFSILITLSIIIALLVVQVQNNLIFNLTLILISIIITYSTIFIIPWIWIKLETKRQLNIEKRIKNKYWALPGAEEQIFPGINDFKI
ncbi:protein translocase subunit SecDF [Mycoplasma sp. 744]|uniref:protein translocase subunit SecDF n=1 Tax=Mycoplasma sp. 744 TaxID=3108531 RepID=UPI002B1CFD91|nr:protein translocase subunit SecDF [Mycoplasma sp. 744]MEA4115277.1 protein translocase subunit SecDF [Mycoplasma sp. 744]